MSGSWDRAVVYWDWLLALIADVRSRRAYPRLRRPLAFRPFSDFPNDFAVADAAARACSLSRLLRRRGVERPDSHRKIMLELTPARFANFSRERPRRARSARIALPSIPAGCEDFAATLLGAPLRKSFWSASTFALRRGRERPDSHRKMMLGLTLRRSLTCRADLSAVWRIRGRRGVNCSADRAAGELASRRSQRPQLRFQCRQPTLQASRRLLLLVGDSANIGTDQSYEASWHRVSVSTLFRRSQRGVMGPELALRRCARTNWSAIGHDDL
jgi:hypothetical protein